MYNPINKDEDYLEAARARFDAKLAREQAKYYDTIIRDMIQSIQDLGRIEKYFTTDRRKV